MINRETEIAMLIVTILIGLLLIVAPVEGQSSRPDPGQQYGVSGGRSDEITRRAGSRYRRPYSAQPQVQRPDPGRRGPR